MTFYERTLESLKSGNVSPYDLAMLMNCRIDSFKNKIREEEVRAALGLFSDDELFHFIGLTSSRRFYWMFQEFDRELKNRCIEVCDDRDYCTAEIVVLMDSIEYPADRISRFCVECGAAEYIKHISRKNILQIPTDRFGSFFDDLCKMKGYNRTKVSILDRDDLTHEQRVYALKSAANSSFSRLEKVCYITADELNALPFGMLKRILVEHILRRWVHKAEFDPRVTVEDVEKMLFVLLIQNERKYQNIMANVQNYMGKTK